MYVCVWRNSTDTLIALKSDINANRSINKIQLQGKC